jgi:hypothetical protein
LAINGSSPLPILEDLAADDAIRGLVVVDYSPLIIYRTDVRTDKTPKEYLARRSGLFQAPKAAGFIDGRLAEATGLLRNRDCSWERLFDRFDEPTSGHAVGYAFTEDRDTELDFLDADPRFVKYARVFFPCLTEGPALDGLIARFARAVERIQARGGAVVLVDPPFGRSIRDEEAKLFPRAVYWEPLLRRTGVVAIHCRDEAALEAFDPPDTLHLDRRDAPRFTVLMLDLIEARLAARGDHRIEAWKAPLAEPPARP